MAEGVTLEAVVKRDRAIVLAGMAGLSALAWAYLLALAWREPHRDMAMAMAMPHMQAWGATEVLLTWVMWAVMMVAMMTPSAAPMILTFATINRRRWAQQGPFVPTTVFALGYLLVWGGSVCWPPSRSGGCTPPRCCPPWWPAQALCWAACSSWRQGSFSGRPSSRPV
jgi:predicted metal-binding membrane protein